ncbi:PIG-L family deacetylase [bacterium]|nr:PIG-L family deacetylase [candidate division CSSED10-310 bacterium]
MDGLFNRILILSPHADDSELGCGGTVARFVEEGREVHVAAFSVCEESVPEGFEKDILFHEWHQALAIMEIPEDCRHLFRYPVRYFMQHRQEILDKLIQFRDQLKPDLVLLPSSQDLHQDHQTIANEGLRAFKGTSMLGFEIPWNNIHFETRSFIHLEKRHIEKKIQALACYRSQGFRGYADPGFIFSLAKTRGVQIEVPYAEVFETIRLIIR